MVYKIKENRVSRTYLGGNKIDEFYGKELCSDSYYPEDWTASVTTAFNGINGEEEGIGYTIDGISMTDILSDEKLDILVKLLNSSERLVIQAHPTIPFAKEFLNSDYGKTECWYFLDCEDDACVYIGLKEGIRREEWEKTFYENDSAKMLSMMHRVSVKKGDFIFVDGGVPHAIGKGCFMIELQEPSDLMVVNERYTPSGHQIAEERLHMGLGYEKMFDVYDYTGYTYDELLKKICPKPVKIQENVYEILGNGLTDKFAMYLLKNNGVYRSDKKYKIAVVTAGEGTVCDKLIKHGDRLFLYNECELKISGTDNFEIVLCE